MYDLKKDEYYELKLMFIMYWQLKQKKLKHLLTEIYELINICIQN